MKKTVSILTNFALFIMATQTLANTCPTHLHQDHKGFWTSHEAPGWKSHLATEQGVDLSSNSFSAAVYSPKYKRLSCVYKADNGKFIALISNSNNHIRINKAGLDDSEKGHAWNFSEEHKDYACGLPSVSHLDGCRFYLNKDQ